MCGRPSATAKISERAMGLVHVGVFSIAIALVSSGCSGAAPDPSASAVAESASASATADMVTIPSEVPLPSVTPSPTVAPEPTTEELAETYIAVIKPMNTWINAKNEDWSAAYEVDDWQSLKGMGAGYAEQYETVATALLAMQWPNDLQDLADEVVASIASEAAYFNKVSTVDNWDDAWFVIDETERSTSTASTDLRIRLGVDSDQLS